MYGEEIHSDDGNDPSNSDLSLYEPLFPALTNPRMCEELMVAGPHSGALTSVASRLPVN